MSLQLALEVRLGLQIFSWSPEAGNNLARSSEEHWLNVESFFLKKVQKEIEDVFDFSGTISYQDQRKFPYTNAVIHETMCKICLSRCSS
ncbi:CYP2B4: Cytochrome protein [Crotalus adamanteus]|uniref:CYP2B4: Cytochrome protein n=1 Tax=Crotalus adamanteus TaxID=8729 RepID=A0AAW1BI34_CROAD